MKRTVISLIAAVALCVSSLVIAAPAMASGAPQLNTPPYNAWGNDTVGNCPFAAIANLVRHMWPKAPITTNEVVRDWRTYGTTIGALPFLFEDGLGGHKIDSYAPVTTRAQFIKAANSGGVMALILGGAHAVAVVGASSSGVTFVTWGTELHVNWAGWNDLDPTSADGVTWAPSSSSTATVMFFPDCGSLVPVTQTEPIGSTEPLAAPVIQDGGVQLPGWMTTFASSPTLYQAGEPYHSTGNVVMWADWPPQDAPAGTVCSD
jgi:hypothetical protein